VASAPDWYGIAALVAASFSGINTLLGSINRRTAKATEKKVENVHAEVSTSNGHTLGELVEQNLSPSNDGSPATREPTDEGPGVPR
jgi:hypothetical protein